MAITITIHEDDFLEMLVDRVRSWTDDKDTIELFEQYYDNMVYGGYFNSLSLSVAEIVDNDYCNNTSVITEDEFNKARVEFLRDNIKSYIEENKDTYDEDEHEEWVADLKAHIEDLKDEAPEWEGLEAGEEVPDFIDGYRVKAKTDKCLLVSW